MGREPVDGAASSPWLATPDVADAILRTVVYADLFDYPLTAQEIHHYLIGSAAPLASVEDCLANHDRLGECLGAIAPFWFLAGRNHLVSLRKERAVFSQDLWREAQRYGRLIAMLPFVRMIAITGSLAMHNVGSVQDDIDVLIVTAKHRVWLSRGMVILVVRLARRWNIELCPNYVIAEHLLHVGEPSLFTAHELAQLVPLNGRNTYLRLLESNAWMSQYLPNAPPRQALLREIGRLARGGQRLMEIVLGGRLGDAVEQSERERKIPRLRQRAELKGGTGAVYAPQLCKGHVNDHGTLIENRYVERLAEQGVQVWRKSG